uniref:Immunoglobulin I-set domain-containing protein n=1 Tax=Scylla olivacea TaxID=85551 RepID=A0A0P4WTV2_SCYOL
MDFYVSDASGMDFRAMLKKKKYAKWKRDNEDPDWGELKEAEKEIKPQLRKVERKQESWIKPLVDLTVKEGKEKMAKFEGEFSKKESKPKWFFKKDELFPGSKYKFKSEVGVHSIIISKPTVEDMGRYSVECMGISCSAILTVQEPDPDYKFVRPLPKKTSCYTTKEATLEAQVNSHKAIVHWYYGDTKIEDNEKYETYKDMTGTVRLTIKKASKKDKGKYTAKIFRCEKEVSETVLSVVDQPFKFTKTLKSRTVTENHKVVLECEVDEAEAPVEWFYGDKKLTPDTKG